MFWEYRVQVWDVKKEACEICDGLLYADTYPDALARLIDMYSESAIMDIMRLKVISDLYCLEFKIVEDEGNCSYSFVKKKED